MLRNCYKCYKSVTRGSSVQEVPRQTRYPLARPGLICAGQAGSWELGLYARKASWASWVYTRAKTSWKILGGCHLKERRIFLPLCRILQYQYFKEEFSHEDRIHHFRH